MDNLDIEWGFTNFQRHPQRKNYMIVHYTKLVEADYFEKLMLEKDYFFERDYIANVMQETLRIDYLTNLLDENNLIYNEEQYPSDAESISYYENLLTEQDISFDSAIIDDTTIDKYVFGVRIGDFDQVNELNYITIGKFKKPMLEDQAVRWAVVIVGGSLILLSIVSWFMSA